MCDFDTARKIEQITLEKAQRGEMFTVFDVTKEIRKETRIKHAEVKTEVHGLYERGQMGTDYTRTLANLPGIDPQPWIYHHVDSDPSQYGQSTLPVSALAPVSVLPDDDDEDKNTYEVDQRETLCIPKHLVQAIGLGVGDVAFVAVDALANVLMVAKNLPQKMLQQICSYTVNCNGNIRITQATLKKAGMGGTQYKIENESDKVFVRKPD